MNFADPLQYRRGPSGGSGPPVENPCSRGRLICSVCNDKHSSILHIQFKEKESKTSQQQGVPVSSAVTTMESCGHTGAREVDIYILSVVPVQGDKMVPTYAFVDHGSKTTFWTEKLLVQLNFRNQEGNMFSGNGRDQVLTFMHLNDWKYVSLITDFFNSQRTSYKNQCLCQITGEEYGNGHTWT